MSCNPQESADSSPTDTGNVPAVGTPEWKVQAYSTAAPPEIAAAATVLDWNDSLTAQSVVLRQGNNGWTCLPLMPPPAAGYSSAIEAAPMCADEMGMLWGAAYLQRAVPGNTSIGLAYMLHGDQGASNLDPFATAATPDNDWVVTGSHVMVFPSDPKSLDAIPSDHRGGGPYVMWRGTPYVHLMMPVGSAR